MPDFALEPPGGASTLVMRALDLELQPTARVLFQRRG